MFPVAYPACNFNGTGEGSFLRDHLGPRMHKDHPDMKIYVHDGQKFHDVPILDRVKAIVAAAGGDTYIHGVAFHWYGNNLKNYQFLEELHDAFPQFDLLATEATLEAPSRQSLGTSPWKEAQKYAVDIIGDLNAGASGWIEWNVLLDSSGGPTCIGTTGGTDCLPLIGHCDAPILADTKKQTLEIRDTYYFMGHFSRFIPPGSTHVAFASGSDGTDTNATFMATAATTPAGDTVVVVLNTDEKNSVHYELEVDGQYAALKIPAHGIQTLTIPAAAAAASAAAAAAADVDEQEVEEKEGAACETCEKVVHLITDVVKFGNVTSQECIEIGDKMCSAVAPGRVEKRACNAIVAAVVAVKDEIIKGLLPPQKICQDLKFC
jgi:glucosylceramidase